MVSLIIPVFNEEKSVSGVIDASCEYLTEQLGNNAFEIIVVDDGSTDSSGKIIQSKKNKIIKYIRHPKQRGVGAARTTGVLHARGDKLLFIDADSTYNPQDFGKVLERLTTYDMVIGARKAERGTLPWLRRFVKSIFCKLAGWLTHSVIPDLNSGLRGMDRKRTLEFLYILPQGHSWVSTITLCFLASGHTVTFVDIGYNKRRGKSSFKIFRDTYSFLLTILKTIVYFYPLRVLIPLSMIFFLGGLIFLIRDIISQDIADTTILLWVVGIIIFIFALMSEQLACLRREINQRISQS